MKELKETLSYCNYLVENEINSKIDMTRKYSKISGMVCPCCRTEQPQMDHGESRRCPGGCGLHMKLLGNGLICTLSKRAQKRAAAPPGEDTPPEEDTSTEKDTPPEETRMIRMLVEDIARVAHEVNRAYCKALGDDSQLPWSEAPAWQRESAIDGVIYHCGALPPASPEASHENWLAEKRANGWRYGPVKDATLKTHPCFVPFDELPIQQKAKDFIFSAIVRSLS